MFKRQIELARKHIVLMNAAHAAGGFGLAILLQYYLSGDPFLPVIVGWILVVFALFAHVYVLIQK